MEFHERSSVLEVLKARYLLGCWRSFKFKFRVEETHLVVLLVKVSFEMYQVAKLSLNAC